MLVGCFRGLSQTDTLPHTFDIVHFGQNSPLCKVRKLLGLAWQKNGARGVGGGESGRSEVFTKIINQSDR